MAVHDDIVSLPWIAKEAFRWFEHVTQVTPAHVLVVADHGTDWQRVQSPTPRFAVGPAVTLTVPKMWGVLPLHAVRARLHEMVERKAVSLGLARDRSAAFRCFAPNGGVDL